MGIKSSRMGGCGLDSYGSFQGPELGTYEHRNEPLSAIKCRGSCNQMRNWEDD